MYIPRFFVLKTTSYLDADIIFKNYVKKNAAKIKEWAYEKKTCLTLPLTMPNI